MALAHAIMTALIEDDLSGYELARDFEVSLGFFWSASHQQIYQELRKMSDNVVRNLAEIGLHEPVSLQMLPGSWWKVHVDAAELNQVSEYGCGYVTLFMSSKRLAGMGFEVVDGPFQAWANTDVTRAILNENRGKYWDASFSNTG